MKVLMANRLPGLRSAFFTSLCKTIWLGNWTLRERFCLWV